MPSIDVPRLQDQVRRVLHENRVIAARGRYTRPAPHTYPHQWLWDSCFHARIYLLLGDEEYARDELRALFREQVQTGLDAGRLPHMTFLGADASELSGDPDARAAYARDTALFGDARASNITQPPIVAETVYLVKDSSFWRELWAPLCRYYDWWIRRRNARADHLYATWHLWECGADAKPSGDEACARLLATGRRARALDWQTVNPTAKKRQDMLAARFLMLEDLQSIDAAEAEGALSEAQARLHRLALFGQIAIDMQAYLVVNLRAMADIGAALGETEASRRYAAEARAIADAANAQLWDEEAGFYFDRFGEPAQTARVMTHAPFIALYAGDLVPKERAERLLEHLLDPNRFWTRWPVPTTARSEKVFDPDDYWRGSTWINVNWFTVKGLILAARRLDDERYLPPARAIAARTLELVTQLGFREYFRAGAARSEDDADVAPMAFGPSNFGWTGLVLDFAQLLENDLR